MGMQGRVALVTGAARGIGRDYALGFAADGAAVVVADLAGGGAESGAAEAGAAGARALAVQVDVADEASVAAMAGAALTLGPVDILVNNAGLWGDLRILPLPSTPWDYWQTVFNVNVGGAFLCARALLPGMRERGFGRIVNQSSAGAYMVPGGLYSITKLALNGLTAHLAYEVGGDGVTVNGLAPGLIDTEASRKQIPKEYLDMLLAQTPIRRAGTGAADLYPMVRYLCSEEAGWVTGQTFLVNGGFMSRM